MEGSNLARSVKGPMKINQGSDRDADGALDKATPDTTYMVGNADRSMQPDVNLGHDGFHQRKYKKSETIKGGQNA